MKRLKPGHKITVVLMSKTWRAKTLRGGRGRLYFRLVDVLQDEKGYRGTAAASDEHVSWVRGWDTHAARALAAATALL